MLTPHQIPPYLKCSFWSSLWLFSFSGSLRLVISSVIVELTFSVPVTGLNAHPAINRLHEHLHPSWRFPETLHLLCQSSRSVFESSGRNHQWFLAVTLCRATIALRSSSNSPALLDWFQGIFHSFHHFDIQQFGICVTMCLNIPSVDPRKGAWLL